MGCVTTSLNWIACHENFSETQHKLCDLQIAEVQEEERERKKNNKANKNRNTSKFCVFLSFVLPGHQVISTGLQDATLPARGQSFKPAHTENPSTIQPFASKPSVLQKVQLNSKCASQVEQPDLE